MLNLIEINCLINDARPDWGYEPLSKATLSHIFMIL